MRMGELSLENYCIVTRGTGKYYISKERADKLMAIINSDDCPRMLKIGENFVATQDIVGIVTAAQVDEMEKRKRGLWQCGKGNWHNSGEVCKCGWGTYVKTDESKLEEDRKYDPERGKLILKLLKKGVKLKSISGLSNEDLKKLLDNSK